MHEVELVERVWRKFQGDESFTVTRADIDLIVHATLEIVGVPIESDGSIRHRDETALVNDAIANGYVPGGFRDANCTPKTVREFMDKARAAGHDAFGIANDPESEAVFVALAKTRDALKKRPATGKPRKRGKR